MHLHTDHPAVLATLFLVFLLLLQLDGSLALLELPKFSQMKLLYPGYHHYGGPYRNHELYSLIQGPRLPYLRRTSALRMSVVLNRFGGGHQIGKSPIFLTHSGQDSYTGKDGQQYIFKPSAFGPFLSSRYGNPKVAKPNKWFPTRTMSPFKHRQGIVLLVKYHKQASGHIALWDCDHFYQSRDWSLEHNIILVEFWEAPDSYCPINMIKPVATPRPQLQAVTGSHLKQLAAQAAAVVQASKRPQRLKQHRHRAHTWKRH